MPKGQPQRLPSIDESSDPMVREMLNEVGRKDEEAKLTPKERKLLTSMRKKEAERQQKARQKAEAQSANRMHLLVPLALKNDLEQVAKEEGVSTSQLVTFFLYYAMGDYQQGKIHLKNYKHPSYSPRYEHELIHPQDEERSDRHGQHKTKKGWG